MEQLALSRFGEGDLVTWWDERGHRIGRFVRVIPTGRHRGAAEVAVGGAISAARVIRVPMERLRPSG